MKKKTRLIIMGVLILVLIAGIVAVVQYNAYQESQKVEESSSLVLKNFWTNDREDIESIQLDTQGDSITLLPKQDANGSISWYLKGHEDWSLRHTHSYLVTLAATFSVFLEIEQAVTTEARKADFGLADPYSTLTVTLKDGTQMQAIIGNKSSDGDYAFCMLTGDDTVYACNDTYVEYTSYTKNSIRLQKINELDVTEGTIYSLFAQKKGERPIRIEYDLDIASDVSQSTLYSPYKLVEPYDVTLEAITGIQEAYFAKLTTPSYVESIDADCQDFEQYGLGDEPEYRETIVSRKKGKDDYVYNTTDYYFGYTYGDKNQYIYFRQGGDNHVMGVTLEWLETRHFDPFYFVNKLVFKAPVRDVASGTVSYQGEEHRFTVRHQEEVEEGANEIIVYRFDDELIDNDTFSNFYLALYSIAPDYEILEEKPDYDENDKLEFSVTNLDGSQSSITYYRLSEFYYVTEISDGVWFSCSSNYFNKIAETMQACVDAINAED